MGWCARNGLTRIAAVVLLACTGSCGPRAKAFNSALWIQAHEGSDLIDSRQAMLSDLIRTHRLIGRSKADVTRLLGPADNIVGRPGDDYYVVHETYYGIDPSESVSFVVRYGSPSGPVTECIVSTWTKKNGEELTVVQR